MEFIKKAQRQAKFVLVVGKLAVMMHDEGKDFDTLIDRILVRISGYEDKTRIPGLRKNPFKLNIKA